MNSRLHNVVYFEPWITFHTVLEKTTTPCQLIVRGLDFRELAPIDLENFNSITVIEMSPNDNEHRIYRRFGFTYLVENQLKF